MNTGIQDAHNLAWKLRAVRDGRASDALLDTYEIGAPPGRPGRTPTRACRTPSRCSRSSTRSASPHRSRGGSRGGARVAHARDARRPGRPRRASRAAIENQRDHFDMFGLQLGFAYEDGALVSDGTPKPAVDELVRATTCPGHAPGARVPHAWVEHARRAALDPRPSSLTTASPCLLDTTARHGRKRYEVSTTPASRASSPAATSPIGTTSGPGEPASAAKARCWFVPTSTWRGARPEPSPNRSKRSAPC